MKENTKLPVIECRRKLESISIIHGHMAPGVLRHDTSISDENHKGIQMYLCDGFIEVVYKGKRVGIPFANCKGWVFA